MNSETKPATEQGTTPATAAAAGRGGRNRNRNRGQRSADNAAAKPKERVPHEGEIAEMNGYVF